MPQFASIAKLLATQSYGADVIQTGETYDEAAEAAQQWIAGNDGNLIPAFNDPRVIAGQGTIGLEILEQNPETKSVIVPAGGGGLLAGIAISLKSSHPDIEIFGVQAEHSQGLVESLKRGAPTTSPPIATIADGIAVATPGRLTFQIIQQHVDHVAAVGESAIESAVITFLERKHIVVEGAGAVPLALLIEGKIRTKAQQLVLVVSGGNLDLQLMDRIIQRGSLRLGRRMRLRIVIPDRPGSLHQITGTIAAQGANILQVYHYRMVPDQPLNVSRVDFELEIRGHHHAEEIIRKIEVEGVRVLR
jgi:threonine dehydratase